VAIAVADAFSDAVGIHISEESEDRHGVREIWEATLSTFVSKFVIAFTFVVPVLLLSLYLAVVVSVAWGLALIIIFSYIMARQQGASAFKVVLEHVSIVVVVILITHYVGKGLVKVFAG
jgi:VIT1/CCC1 family predicted Fe2+/Mn2+ transporter